MGTNRQSYRQGLARRQFLKLSAGAGLLATLPMQHVRAQKLLSKASILIVGGGAAGISMANRLRNALEGASITLVGARTSHLYQPGLTLVASGLWHKQRVITQTRDWLPDGVNWIEQDAMGFDPDSKQVILTDGQALGYDLLVIATGCQLNYHEIEGMRPELIGSKGIGSVYAGPDAAAGTDRMIQAFINKGSGRALFTLANTPIKCAGAPLKLTFTSLDRFEQSGRRADMDVSFITPYKGKVFSIKYYNDFVQQRWQKQGVNIQDQKLLSAIDADKQLATFTLPDGTSSNEEYDFIHVVPPMSAPDALRNSDLVWQEGSMAGNWVEVDQYSLQHRRYPEIFAIGDAAGIPMGKTAASVKRQAPVLEANIRAFLSDQEPSAKYDGYTSCPLITRIGRAMLVEFGYGGELMPSFPFISPKEESWVAWVMKEKMLQPAYYAMLHGRI